MAIVFIQISIYLSILVILEGVILDNKDTHHVLERDNHKQQRKLHNSQPSFGEESTAKSDLITGLTASQVILIVNLLAVCGVTVIAIGVCVQCKKRHIKVKDDEINLEKMKDGSPENVSTPCADELQDRHVNQDYISNRPTENETENRTKVCLENKQKKKARVKKRRHSYENVTRAGRSVPLNSRRKVSLTGFELAKLHMDGYEFAKDVTRDGAGGIHADTTTIVTSRIGINCSDRPGGYDHVTFKPVTTKASESRTSYVYFYNHLERPASDGFNGVGASGGFVDETYSHCHGYSPGIVAVDSHHTRNYSTVTIVDSKGDRGRRKDEYDHVEITCPPKLK